MNVTLEAIKFNHDRNSIAADAFNIRKNETELVSVPEWRRVISVNPEDSLAAYSIHDTRGNTLTIQARITWSDDSVRSLEVRTIDARLPSDFMSDITALVTRLVPSSAPMLHGNILGNVKTRRIHKDEAEFEAFELKDVKLWDAGVSVSDVYWRWQYRLDAGSEWIDFAETRHRVFAVLSLPKKPWTQENTSSNIQLPWTEVLSYACRWAEGAKNNTQAATSVTHAVNRLGPQFVQFDTDGCANGHYTSTRRPLTFDCTDFLQLLKGKDNYGGHKVNCTDCATIVSTFANIVGCELSQSGMAPDFELNPHRRIGLPRWQGERESEAFSFHMVAWEGEGGEDDAVFDACLKVDGDEDPSQNPTIALLPTNLKFGRIGEHGYRFRLVKHKDEGRCKAVQDPFLRSIGHANHQGSALTGNQKILDLMKIEYDFESWRQPELTDEPFNLKSLALDSVDLAGWEHEKSRLIEDEGFDPVIQIILKANDHDPTATVRMEVQASQTSDKAREGLMEVLSGFQLRRCIRRRQPPEFGEVQFASEDDVTVLFVRKNLTVLLRNIGPKAKSLTDLAKRIDQRLIKTDAADALVL